MRVKVVHTHESALLHIAVRSPVGWDAFCGAGMYPNNVLTALPAKPKPLCKRCEKAAATLCAAIDDAKMAFHFANAAVRDEP